MWGGIKGYLYIGLAAGAIFLSVQGLAFVNTAMDNAATVVRQEIQLEIRDAAIVVLESEKAQIVGALEIAEDARLVLETRNTELRDIRDSALMSGDENNGTISTVLGDTLRALSTD